MPAILRGFLEQVTRILISGWAQDSASPDIPVVLLITEGDELLARVIADQPRADLREAGIGDGAHAFEVKLQGLDPDRSLLISVRREEDGAHLSGSPVLLGPARQFDDAFCQYCAAILQDRADEAGRVARLDFLARQTQALLDRRVVRRTRAHDRAVSRQIAWRRTGQLDPQDSDAFRRRALVVDEFVPVPARDGGSNAVLSHMNALLGLGFEVTFAAADMGTDRDRILQSAGIAVCQAPWHGSVEEVLRSEAGGFDLVYLHRPSVAARYLGLVGFHQSKARLIYSVADLHHLRLARQAEAEQRPELLAVARRFAAVEWRAAAAAHAVITHSSFEAGLIRQHLPSAQVHVVPWSVPLQATPASFAARHGIAFIGHYGHAPNLDAAQWLIDEIMPTVRLTHPAIDCRLIGSAMPEVLRTPRPGIEPVGQVAALADVLNRVRLTVAPMTYGAGIKAKVLDSLAAGVPCVCSPIAAEGLDLPPLLRSLVAGDVTAIAATIIRLHEDAALFEACREAGLSYIAAGFSQTRIQALMGEAAGSLPGSLNSERTIKSY